MCGGCKKCKHPFATNSASKQGFGAGARSWSQAFSEELEPVV